MTSHRILFPRSGRTNSTYKSCLEYSYDELQSFCQFETDMPSCPGYQEFYGSECGSGRETNSHTGKITGRDDDDDYFTYDVYRNDDG